MKETSNPTFSEAMAEAKRMPQGNAKISLLDKAVNIADTQSSMSDAFRARMLLVENAIACGLAEKAIVAYSWCLSQCDQFPEKFPERKILWEYKWIINHAVSFPEITLDQLQGLFDDMAKRYERNGFGVGAVRKKKINFAIRMGFHELAKKEIEIYRTEARSQLEDCRACVKDAEVIWAIYLYKNDNEAVELAKPIVEGRLSCEAVPAVTYGRLLEPLVRLNRISEAEQYHIRGYDYAKKNKKYLTMAADHFRYAVLSGKLESAHDMLEKHLHWALETKELEDRFEFFIPCIFYLQRLSLMGKQKIDFKPIKPIAKLESDQVNTLLAWFEKEIDRIADQFDQRNGNKFFTSRLQEIDALQNLATIYEDAR